MTDEAFEQAARGYANTIFRVACHALKDRQEAEDVTQTVLLRLYQYTGEFQSEIGRASCRERVFDIV